MSKALVTISDIAWDNTNGWASDIRYAIDTNGTGTVTAILSGVFSLSQAETYKDLIRAFVVSDALSRYSITLTKDDVILLF